MRLEEAIRQIIKRLAEAPTDDIRRGVVAAYGNVRPSPGGVSRNSTGSQLGHGNIGGGRNRGKPGYPVPPEMSPDNMSTLETEDIRTLGEATEGIQKSIPHLEDLKPEQFLEFLRKFAETETPGLEISEKVDGSARLTFGKGAGHIWTQTKSGSRKARSDQYPDTHMYRAIRAAHWALESAAGLILPAWPENVEFFVAEVLHSKVPNTIEYGPDAIVIHGVHTTDGAPADEKTAKALAQQIIAPTKGHLKGENGDWLFEYKRTIDPKDVMVDVKKEYETLGALYRDLAKKPRDKNLKSQFQDIQKQVKQKLVAQLRKQRSAYGPEGGDIEGLVFRDLDSGQMTKLVDRDFFTQLNRFLWHHRELLHRGAMVGGQWKHGVMAKLQRTVADQVLGDSMAGSTSFLRTLVSKYAPRVSGKTAEERADKALALYVKENDLMTGEFAREYQKALMGAFKDFAALKREWERFKEKPQSIKLGDKERAYPPEHIARTDEELREGEAALAGIKAGLEVASKIKHPLTQKTAILKLFMGHKFEKLVSSLSHESGELDEGWRPLALAAALSLGAPAAGQDLPAAQRHNLINSAARDEGIDPELLRAVVDVESKGDPGAKSHKGAVGLAQLMPKTAEWLGVKDPTDPEQNLHGAAKYLRMLTKSFGGDTRRALAAYNMGPAAVRRTPEDKWPGETKAYVKKVMAKLPQATADIVAQEGLVREAQEDLGPEGQSYVVQLYKMLLHKHGIRVQKWLGAGQYGDAFDIGGGKVLKVTRDDNEAKASNYLKGKSLKHVARIYDVFKFPDHPSLLGYDYYGIVLERLKPLTGSLEEAVSQALFNVQEAVGTDIWADRSIPSQRLFEYYVGLFTGKRKAEAQADVGYLQKVQIGEMRDELMQQGVIFHDMHPGNLGQRPDGTWACFDLGSESVSPGQEPHVLEGGPIDRMTGATDMGGGPRVDSVGLDDAQRVNEEYPEDPDCHVGLESVVYESVRRLLEAQQGTVGATIGRYQPFHAGHAAIIRRLAGTYSTVLVFIAGQRQDKRNPFPHDLRLRMMELSLPDVWTKVKVFPATIQGKGTGYIPGLVANAAASGEAGVQERGSVDVLVGEDRVSGIETQVAHNNKRQGEPGYYNGVLTVSALPGVKNDDDADRISGTVVREALARDDKESVRKLLDPHLAQSAEFEGVYAQLREAMKRAGLIQEMSAGAMGTTVGDTRTGRWGTSAWSNYNPRNNDRDDPVFQAMMRSPSTRMLSMTNSGTPNDHMPGQDSLDQRPEDEQDFSKPTDLDEAVFDIIRKSLS